MHFLFSPSYFEVASLLIFLLIVLFTWYKLYKTEKNYVFLSYHRRTFLFKNTLRLLVMVSAILALLAPFKRIMKQQVNADNHHMYFLLDLSNSMRAQDTPPGRLERAKYSISKIVQKSQGSYCIILFSNEAIVYCPLTRDKEAILDLYLPSLTFGITSGGASNIGSAYTLAMKKVVENHKKGVKNSIICFSDWESNNLPATSLFKDADTYNLSFYHVVIGSSAGDHIPWKTGILTKDGKAVLTKAMPEKASALCERTNNCSVFRISREMDDTAALIKSINESGATITSEQHVAAENIYYLPLMVSILCLVLDLLLPLPLIYIKP
jgi:Ca-activated chloride channel family protein